MSWGRLKPFWKSKAWKKSAKNQTGFFSWGDSNVANILDPTGTLDKAIDQATKAEQDRLLGQNQTPVSEQLAGIPTGTLLMQNKNILMIVGALVAYKLFLK